MSPIYDALAPKKTTNLSINSDLLSQARNLRINLSATLEQALAETLQQRQRGQWLADNQAAIAAYNERVERDSIFSDEMRAF